MDTKMVTQSVDDATKAIKSSFSEGSSKLFGSMRDAKRGFLGGITSTFDHVVNIVGGPEDGANATAAAAAAKETSPSGTPGTAPPGSKPRPPKPPAPTARRSSDADFNGSVKQFDADDGGTTTGSGSRVSRQNTAPSGYGGQPSVGGHSEASVPRSERRRRGSDSDADSEATEGCDERQDVDDFAEGGLHDEVRSSSQSRNSDLSSTNEIEDVSLLDPTTRDCVEFIKYIVQKIFDPNAQITPTDKAKFGEMCQQGTGRIWFAKYVNAQRVHSKQVPEQVIFGLVQFFAVVLFECNEAEDYGPATTLMNMAFTFYHEVQDPKTQDANIFTKLWSRTQPKPKMYLYSYLTDQTIWQSPRFWNAAFFYAVQHERASKPTATSDTEKQEQVDDARFQQNITFGQLRTFSTNMRALGVPKDQCLEFIRRQSTIANLPQAQVKSLRENMEQWKDESATK